MILRNRLLIALYVRRRMIFYLVVICAVGAYGVFRFFPDREKEVRKRFELLEKGVSMVAGANVLLAGKRAQDVGNLFSDECVFQTDYSYLTGVFNSRRITQLVIQFHSEVSSVALDLEIKKVKFPRPDAAEVLSVGKMRGILTEGEPFAENHVVIFKLEKTEGKWLITEVRVFDDLKNLGEGFL